MIAPNHRHNTLSCTCFNTTVDLISMIITLNLCIYANALEHQQNEVTLQRRKIEDLSFSTTLLDEQYTIICELRKVCTVLSLVIHSISTSYTH